jgi:tetratricopeptide (TPR) repeat protein
VTDGARFFFLSVLALTEMLSCKSPAPAPELPIPAAPPPPAGERREGVPSRQEGVVEEIRVLTESGVLSSMLRALELIHGRRDLESSEFGRVMSGVNTALIRRIYPDSAAQLPPVDLPQSHVYARILREAERGGYTRPAADSSDYLEYILPFLALLDDTSQAGQERFLSALPDLETARKLRPDSTLAPFFSALALEKAGRLKEAEKTYADAYAISSECYPAMMGLVRLINNAGRKKEALKLLSDLAARYPGNMEIKRQLAAAYYDNGDWTRAEPLVEEVLRRDSRDGDFILMWAHILMERDRFAQAQTPLDQYAAIDPNNRLYLFLRARLQAEGYHNRDSALNFLRSILRVSPGDEEALIYAARLLMESPRPADESEGRELLGRLLKSSSPSPAVLSLALRDAVRREDWQEAQELVNSLLKDRRSTGDLLDAYTVERGLGNRARALAYARELYERDPSDDEGRVVYIAALIDAGRREEAGKMIESRLSALAGGQVKSRYYYLRSRLRTDEEAALADLRSSLFEDPRNLDTLIAMLEVYHRRKDERRAVYYLKQALAIAPGSPRLKRYEREYADHL